MVSIRCNGPIACGLLAGLFLVTNLAAAQTPGTRAAGMAEAFVGVADDATAVYWNPAGMATGAYFSFVVDFADGEGLSEGPDEDPGASSHDARFIGLTVPSLGLAYTACPEWRPAPRPLQKGVQSADKMVGVVCGD